MVEVCSAACETYSQRLLYPSLKKFSHNDDWEAEQVCLSEMLPATNSGLAGDSSESLLNMLCGEVTLLTSVPDALSTLLPSQSPKANLLNPSDASWYLALLNLQASDCSELQHLLTSEHQQSPAPVEPAPQAHDSMRVAIWSAVLREWAEKWQGASAAKRRQMFEAEVSLNTHIFSGQEAADKATAFCKNPSFSPENVETGDAAFALLWGLCAVAGDPTVGQQIDLASLVARSLQLSSEDDLEFSTACWSAGEHLVPSSQSLLLSAAAVFYSVNYLCEAQKWENTDPWEVESLLQTDHLASSHSTVTPSPVPEDVEAGVGIWGAVLRRWQTEWTTMSRADRRRSFEEELVNNTVIFFNQQAMDAVAAASRDAAFQPETIESGEVAFALMWALCHLAGEGRLLTRDALVARVAPLSGKDAAFTSRVRAAVSRVVPVPDEYLDLLHSEYQLSRSDSDWTEAESSAVPFRSSRVLMWTAVMDRWVQSWGPASKQQRRKMFEVELGTAAVALHHQRHIDALAELARAPAFSPEEIECAHAAFAVAYALVRLVGEDVVVSAAEIAERASALARTDADF
eukprot:CAMPEP_0114555806 /NCGR_PEP_ID=MMETSP0114-20121206/8948_1 /TAXON_ID=31324 /ORGANISM="Goniomonas sp, Strain m" /LENGTH=572 /DNA_ID=CAMNT_0001740961 /DNA_START=17 /DNA_END=1732 /DNA_ORIENTATION=+